MSESGIELSLEDGMWLATEFLLSVGAHGTGIIAGSIRRRRPVVHDIDLVFTAAVNRGYVARYCSAAGWVKKWGPKLAAIKYCGAPIDLYFSTLDTFNTLLLIRTGSKENNIRLASIAKRRGWKLHASGDGLFNERGERIAGDSERSIYDALGEKWQEPWERG